MQLPETINEAKIWAVVVGALGATASLTFIKDMSWPQKIAMVVYGTVMSVLFTDPVVALVNMPTGLASGVAFLVGMFSMTLAGAVITAFRGGDVWNLIADIARSWLRRGG